MEPLLDPPAVMHAQVDDQKNFLGGVLDQGFQKLDEALVVDRAFHDLGGRSPVWG
jgi:hypothetical protein